MSEGGSWGNGEISERRDGKVNGYFGKMKLRIKLVRYVAGAAVIVASYLILVAIIDYVLTVWHGPWGIHEFSYHL